MTKIRGRANVVRAHITQDKWGLWMMTLETANGKLSLDSYGNSDANHDIEDAYTPEAHDLPPDTEFHISISDKPANWQASDIKKPRASRAKPPYYVVKNGEKVKEVLK